MPPKFGTSGLRGLVVDLTPDLIAQYTRAFLSACPHGRAVHVGRDLRASSPALAETVLCTVCEAGLDAIDHGALPTPALALTAGRAGQAAIMVTGSHIPADRNGLKFYRPDGEISKTDEAAILAACRTPFPAAVIPGTRRQSTAALNAYTKRYLDAFGKDALSGLRIGVYEHSSVARDVMGEVLSGLGADVVGFARSETFIPVDTEAVDPQTRAQFSSWCADYQLDALVSTDGDADRPMVTDADGQIIPGDVLGPLTARSLGAELICTPVSSNTLVEAMGDFTGIRRTRIGSPYVIAAMEAAVDARVAGYEANGGFLLGFEASGPAGPLAPLMTRDCLLPIVAPLAATRAAGQPLAVLVTTLPARFTATDRISEITPDRARSFLGQLIQDPVARATFFSERATEAGVDLTDGLRVRFVDDTVIHLRPSGNAPEFRCYAEADTAARARTLMRETLEAVALALS
ncbi:phosphomannomutase [uncultured Roseobacter sp.]|uniref:phosphomannomutase n=1 Tax=uncultured Roseobacter sp. TaxID=114847 RepID=UPI00261CEC87|nr:phosphomannomutase [uncultured Roseobacter sp.]